MAQELLFVGAHSQIIFQHNRLRVEVESIIRVAVKNHQQSVYQVN